MPRATKDATAAPKAAAKTRSKALPAKAPRAAATKVPRIPKAEAHSPAAAAATATKARKAAPLDDFLLAQRSALLADRDSYVQRAETLKAEAEQMAEDMEPGDTQFDEESGEGDTINVERERDLALSAQARQAVDEIDQALGRIEAGTYGVCERCGSPIPRARLKALPHAALCVACKSGGLSRR